MILQPLMPLQKRQSEVTESVFLRDFHNAIMLQSEKSRKTTVMIGDLYLLGESITQTSRP